MLLPPPFPTRIEDLTPVLLSQAIGADVDDVTWARIGADRGMLGEIYLVSPTYSGPSPGPDQVVVKLAAEREGSLASARRARTNERELRCYDELLGDTPVSAPGHFGCWYDPDTARFLLVQEAIETDSTVDQVAGIDVGRAGLVVVEAARLHARWWKDPSLEERDWLPRLDSPMRLDNLRHLAAAGWPLLCELLGDELSPAERRLGTEFPDRLEAALRRMAAAPATLVHSDLRADNLLFSPDGSQVTLVDWQGVGLGPPGFDLGYFLSQSLTVADRRAHEAALLDRYRSTLTSAGLELSDGEVRVGYADAMHYGLAVACALPIIGDPAEPRVRSLAGSVTRRSIEALRDHDQLWETGP